MLERIFSRKSLFGILTQESEYEVLEQETQMLAFLRFLLLVLLLKIQTLNILDGLGMEFRLKWSPAIENLI